MARNPKPVRRLYKTIQASVRGRFGQPLRNLTYGHVRDAMRPVTIWEWSWEWRGSCDHPNKGVTYRDAVVAAWACPDCETEWEEPQ